MLPRRIGAALLFLALSGLVLVSCRLVGKTAGDLFVPPERERALGQEFAREIQDRVEVLEDRVVQEYVDRVGQRIAAASDRKDLRYRFTVIEDAGTVNAFAVPGGYLYVYTGLLLAMEAESELAGVLGHEVAHVVARHSANQMGLRIMAELGLGSLEEVWKDESETTRAIAALAASVAVTGGLLQYGRDDEREADELGLGYTIRAGYDPRGFVTFFEKLSRLEGRAPSAVEAFFASHPPTSERMGTLRAEIARRGDPGGEVGRDAYLQMRRRLERRGP